MPGGAFGKPSGLALRAVAAGRVSPSISFGIAKGLAEPCYPNRKAYFFGADLNSINADNWNCLASLVDTTNTYDLSAIKPQHEVLVALVNLAGPFSGGVNYTFKWYRNRDDKLLYSWSSSIPEDDYDWAFAYSYIGYVSWELFENGEHRVEATVTGAVYRSFSQTFTITGIPAEGPAPELPAISFMGFIIDQLNAVALRFYQAYYEVNSWGGIFVYLADYLKLISDGLYALVKHFWTFRDWVTAATSALGKILSVEGITRLITDFLTIGIELWQKFTALWDLVGNVINEWWLSTLTAVKGLIESATQGLAELLSGWNDFWVTSFPTLVNWTWLGDWWTARLVDLTSLINTAFTIRESLWSGWQEVRTNVLEFLGDPLEWLWSRFTDWFLGKE